MPNPHMFGFVHQAYHQSAESWRHIKNMGYNGATVFQDHYGNEEYAKSMAYNMLEGAIYIARDHPLTEQHNVLKDPTAGGIEHANSYIRQVREGKYLLPLDDTYFAGLNEVSTYDEGAIAALVSYDLAFLRRLEHHPDVPSVPPLKGAALRLSTGHPPTYDWTPNTVANWEVFDPVFSQIIEGDHIAEIHEYGRYDDIFEGSNILRIQHLHRFDFPIVIGEVGIDDHVNRPAPWPHVGWQQKSAQEYLDWLDVIHNLYTGFPNVISLFVFVGDHAHPWSSFDIFREEMMRLLEGKRWTWSDEFNPYYERWLRKAENLPEVYLPIIVNNPNRSPGDVIVEIRKLLVELERMSGA